MANSRRRERELARRRYERRRLREQELRAKRRRRNTIIGASTGTAAVVALIVVLAVVYAGGGGKPAAQSTPAATLTATPPTSVPTSPPPAPTKCAKIKPNPPAKGQPNVPDVTGKVPTNLVTRDIKVGHGKAAKQGATIEVTYIGISCSTGKVFDASYLHGNKPFPLTGLGHAQVIPGWNQGLIGVKAGGVRELIIPPALGYGPTGSGPIRPNEELIFLVTVKSVKAA